MVAHGMLIYHDVIMHDGKFYFVNAKRDNLNRLREGDSIHFHYKYFRQGGVITEINLNKEYIRAVPYKKEGWSGVLRDDITALVMEYYRE